MLTLNLIQFELGGNMIASYHMYVLLIVMQVCDYIR